MKKNKLLLLLVLPLLFSCGGTKPSASNNSEVASETPSSEVPSSSEVSSEVVEEVNCTFEYDTTQTIYTNYEALQAKQTLTMAEKDKSTTPTTIAGFTETYWKNQKAFLVGAQAVESSGDISDFKAKLGDEQASYLLGVDVSRMFISLEYQEIDGDAFEKLAEDLLANIENGDDVTIIEERLDKYIEDYRNLIDMDELINVKAHLFLNNDYYQDEMNRIDLLYTSINNSYKKIFQELLKSDTYKDQIVTYYEMTQDDIDSFLEATVYDDATKALVDQETELENQYTSNSDTMKNAERNELYIKLVNLRKQIATNLGYDNYLEYRYQKAYNRSYSLADANNFLEGIIDNMGDTYATCRGRYNSAATRVEGTSVTETQLLDGLDYVAEHINPKAKNVIRDMRTYGYYDFDSRSDKYGGSYQTSLNSEDDMHFIHVTTSNTVSDYPTVFHEFGHYLAAEAYDPALEGDKWDLDVAEIHSQGLEYLMGNFFTEFMDSSMAVALNKVQAFNAMWTIMSGTLVASFENYVYTTTDKLSSINLQNKFTELFNKTTYPYCFSFDGQNPVYSVVSHIFTSPGYYISYVTSIMAALQIYANPDIDSAISQYNTIVDYGTSNDFLYVLNKAGLSSPFDNSVTQKISAKIEAVAKASY